MLRRLYDRMIALAETPYALWVLAAVAFAESSVFPLPPDLLIVPMVIARPERAWRIAGVALAASVLGGLLGYWIGAALFESVGRPVLAFYGMTDTFDTFAARYNAFGPWAVLIGGVTPFPYKVITILSGATHLSLPVFVVASVIARALRFFVIGALLWRFGAPIRGFIERRLGLLLTAGTVLLIGGFAAVKLL